MLNHQCLLQGGLFAADSPYYLWLVPTLVQAVTVSIINTIYSSVAEKCTNLENHRSAFNHVAFTYPYFSPTIFSHHPLSSSCQSHLPIEPSTTGTPHW